MKSLLLVDDEKYLLEFYRRKFRTENLTVYTAGSVSEAKNKIEKFCPDLTVIDVVLRSESGDGKSEEHDETIAGIELGIWMNQKYPGLPFIGWSAVPQDDVEGWFKKYGRDFVPKSGENIEKLVSKVNEILYGIRIFIVHGNDDHTKLQAKNFFQNQLGLPEPIILQNRPNDGLTIIEKFEKEASNVNKIVVLLTPDDKPASPKDDNEMKRRARQNVIFELGYFYGRFGRKSGQVILLHKGPIELPSDIVGIVSVDISNGIESKSEEIRRELKL